MSMSPPLGASIPFESSNPPAAPAPSTAPTAATAPRFSLLGLILLTSLVAVLCGAIFGMPIRVGTLVLLVVNLCFAPVALAGIVCGQGYLRAACLGLVLPGLAVWWVGTSFYQTVATALDFTMPMSSPYAPYYPGPVNYLPVPAPSLTPPSIVYPATSAPPESEPAASGPASDDPAGSDPATAPDSASTPTIPSPAGPVPAWVQPVPPQIAYSEWLDPSYLILRQLLIANPLLAGICVACAVATKWFHDLQPATA